jgi:DNA-binding transcriptional LysR family regulator
VRRTRFAAHPGVQLSLLEDGSDQLIERVRSGAADLALTGAAAMPAGLEGFPVISERLVTAVPADHPLTCRKRVTLADIAAHPVICLPEGTGVRAVFDRGCAARGVRPDIALQARAGLSCRPRGAWARRRDPDGVDGR